jgi:hypothetical protein
MRPFTTVHLRFDTTAGGFQPDPTLYKPVRWGSLSQVGGSEAMLIAPPVSMTVHANNGPGGRARPVGPDDGSTPSTAVAAGPTASRSAANAVDTTRVIFGAASAVRVGAAVAGVSELDRLTDVLNSTNGRVAASAAMAVTAVGIVRSSANAEGSIANVTPPAKRDRAIMVPLLPGGDPPSLPDPRGVASGSILYYRDYQERPYKAEGWLLHQPATPRNRAAQDELTGMGGEFRGTDASHLIARIFGGDGEKYNLVPFYSDRNKGLINQLETSWRRELQDGTHLYLQVYADYRGKEKIPTALHYYVYELRGSTLSFREKHTVRKDGLDQ